MLKGAGALAALALLSCACRRDARVHPGDSVSIHYELSVDGVVRESNFEGPPAPVVQGGGDLPPGLDAALLGMEPGAEKRLVLPPEKAFGVRDPARVQTVPLKSFGDLAAGLKPGKIVSGFRDGKAERAVVVSVGGGSVVLDFNPPLAGKTVSYRLQVVSVGEAR